VVLESGGTAVLLDAGFSCRDLEARLAAVGVDPARVKAMILTHEHGDHARGSERFARRFGCEIAATTSTLRCLGLRSREFRWTAFESGRSFRVAGWRVESAGVPHDAADPVALRLETDGASVGYAMDLGHAPPAVRSLLEGCEILIVESNHDVEMLERGPYPEDLKDRLRGPRGHLSNEEAAELIAATVDRRTRALVLAHLSRTNNRADLAMLAAHRALGSGAAAVRMRVAEQGPAAEWVETR
jgi:phosphoribosyl 1,2-cyclic phosphodiesterase